MTFGAGYAVLRSKEPERFLAKKAENDEREAHVHSRQQRRMVLSYQQLWEPWFQSKRLAALEVIGFSDTRAGYTLDVSPR